jgi:hypothetical protein
LSGQPVNLDTSAVAGGPPRSWVDLTPWWGAVVEYSRARKEVMRGRTSGKHWIDNTDLPAVAGEAAFALLTGRRVSRRLRRPEVDGDCWDGGWDFQDPDGTTIDVKATPWLASRVHLQHFDPPRYLATFYVLTVVDVSRRRAAYVGWAWGVDLMRAPLKRLNPAVSDARRAMHESRLHSTLLIIEKAELCRSTPPRG